MKPFRVLIVDDHPMFREALQIALSMQSDFVVVGQAEDGEQAISTALNLRPDVIVMDINLPVKSGIEAISEILHTNPAARIMAITSSIGNDQVLAAVKAGAAGYILKDASSDEFMAGLRIVASGRQYLPHDVALKLMSGLRQQNMRETHPMLTDREQEVLVLVGKGFSNEWIAKELSLSVSTVRVHVFNILKKLQLENRNQAIVYASQHNK
ncbi:MAG: response regulator transcription factor [Chloroflexi bacterium]|nr:response regulator transcription factor [Chloroflexota bacterium]